MESRDYQKLVEEYDRLKRSDLQDLSADQDLVLAIMNLISIEEHLIFTGTKTEQPAYYQLIPDIRGLRKQLLQRVVSGYEGEVWCISKHLLAASYRLLEVGSKQMDLANEQLATSYYQQAYHLYNLFWGLAMKLIPQTEPSDNQIDSLTTAQELNLAGSKEEAANTGSTSSRKPSSADKLTMSSGQSGWQHKLRKMVQKLVNCCIE